MDWFENYDAGNGFVFYTTPARHFSGRGFIHKKTLWVSFVLQTPSVKIFIGGDGGYDNYFAGIGEKVDLKNPDQQFTKWWENIN